MHNYVSCLGMTTYKVSANIRFHRTSKSAFLFGGPGTFLFGKHKKKCPREFPPAFPKAKKQNKNAPGYPEALLWIWEFGRGKSI